MRGSNFPLEIMHVSVYVRVYVSVVVARYLHGTVPYKESVTRTGIRQSPAEIQEAVQAGGICRQHGESPAGLQSETFILR
jgi:hypothetical protein